MKYTAPIVMLAVFEAIAVTLWLTKGNVFYLVNFSYIGGAGAGQANAQAPQPKQYSFRMTCAIDDSSFP